MADKEKPNAKEVKVLVADDVQSMRLILKSMLKQMGFINIVEASDGKAAIKTLERATFQLIICDWQMPSNTGDEILKITRESENNKDAIFIMCTGNTNPENVKSAIAQGVSNFITKPFNQEIVLEKLKKYFILKD